MNYVRNVERGLRRPRPESLAAICRALDLSEQQTAAIFRLAGVQRLEPPEPSPPELALWRHLPSVLLLNIAHDEFLFLGSAADDAVADATRALGSVCAWLTAHLCSLTRTQVAHLRAAGRRFSEQASSSPGRVFGHGPLAAGERAIVVASGLPLAWRRELFAGRGSALHCASHLKQWTYQPARAGTSDVPQVSAWFNDEAVDREFGFYRADPRFLVSLHDAMTARHLWEQLELEDEFGPWAPTEQEIDVLHHLGAPGPMSDLAFVLEPSPMGPSDLLSQDRRARERAEEFRKSAVRVDLLLRLYQVPAVAGAILRHAQPGQPDAPVPRDALVAALAAARDRVGALSVRFPAEPSRTSRGRDNGGSNGA
jgi:hypothetical protein